MRGFFDFASPSYERILLIESGSRQIGKALLTRLYALQEEHRAAQHTRLDLLTCFTADPENFDERRGALLRVTERHIASRKIAFLRELVSARYTTIVVIADGEATMRRWKWTVGALSSSKLIVCRDASNLFLLDAQQIWAVRSRYAARFRRPNLSWVLRVASLSLAPFSISFLAVYAAALHAKRLLNRSY